MKHPFFLIAAFLITVFTFSCNSVENQRLVIEPEVFSLTEGENATIVITQGSGSYTIACDDEQILLAGFSRTGKNPGELLLTGLITGETWVSLTDNTTGDHAKIKVTITCGEE